jgi:PAS domain S-box-containing protein
LQNELSHFSGTVPENIRSSNYRTSETEPRAGQSSRPEERNGLAKQVDPVHTINTILVSSLPLKQIISAVESELILHLPCASMTLVLFDDPGGFRFYSSEESRQPPCDPICGAVFPVEGTPYDAVIRTGLPLIISRAEEDHVALSSNVAAKEISSLLIHPLTCRGKIFGAIELTKKTDLFSESHISFLDRISTGLGICIQNSLLIEDLETAEERYRTVVEGAHEGVMIGGEGYRFRYVNQKFAEIAGYSRNELMSMDFPSLLDEEGRSALKDIYAGNSREEETFPKREFNLIRKNGEMKNVEIHSKFVRDSRGVVNAIAFVSDVTDKKRIQEQWVETEKLRALGEMASGVAHDFNNALAVILGNTQLVLYTLKDGEVRGTLQTIEKVAKDAAQTVRRLQEFTRKDIHQELFPLDINTIVKDAIQITRPIWKDELQGKGIHIDMRSDCEDVPPVKGNASELREVITNMIFNAIEAMPEGGKIEIRTFKRKENVTIQIADTGIGMPEQVKNKAFEPFFTTKPFSNTGLGLSMSYGIIKRLGGEIGFETVVGRGTTFDISLPAAVAGKEMCLQ